MKCEYARGVVGLYVAFLVFSPMVTTSCGDLDLELETPLLCGMPGKSCELGQVCTAKGLCCTLDTRCDGRDCGLDKCGWGTCGDCAKDENCTAGICKACTPNCGDKKCGPDDCEGSCGDCAAGTACNVAGQCVCQPVCDGKTCGKDNGCEGICECVTGQTCCEDGTCKVQCQTVDPCDGKECSTDGICGSCDGDRVCANGQCACPGTKPDECGESSCCTSDEECNEETGACEDVDKCLGIPEVGCCVGTVLKFCSEMGTLVNDDCAEPESLQCGWKKDNNPPSYGCTQTSEAGPQQPRACP